MQTTPGARRKLLFVMHFAFFTLLAPSLLYMISQSIRKLFGISTFATNYLGVSVGVLLLIVGVAVMTRGDTDMYRYGGGGTPIPFYSPPKKLVREGIYRCTRNPMYLGTTLEYIGVGLILGEYFMILFSILILFFALTLYRIYETPYLKERFGDELREYSARTPLLIPKSRCLMEILKNRK